jgi:hypothetical protein
MVNTCIKRIGKADVYISVFALGFHAGSLLACMHGFPEPILP